MITKSLHINSAFILHFKTNTVDQTCNWEVPSAACDNWGGPCAQLLLLFKFIWDKMENLQLLTYCRVRSSTKVFGMKRHWWWWSLRI